VTWEASAPGIRPARAEYLRLQPHDLCLVCFGGAGYLRIAAAPYNTPEDYDLLAATVRELLD